MTAMNTYLSEVFPNPPMTAFKRQRNIKDFIIRAKVFPPPKRNNTRILIGMRKCNRPCPACPFIEERKVIRGDNFTWQLRKNFNCESKHVIYMIECSKSNCNERYIGETGYIKRRISDHVGYVKSKVLSKATGYHFNLPGHNISHLRVTIVEKVKKNNTFYRKEREHYHINKFNTFYKGMNRTP